MSSLINNLVSFSAVLGEAQAVVPRHLLSAQLLAVVIFSIVGIAVFFLSLFVMEKITHFSIVHEICEEHNTALAVIVGAIVLGISIIIAAAIVG